MSSISNEVFKATARTLYSLHSESYVNKRALALFRRSSSFSDKNALEVWSVIFSNADEEILSKSEKPNAAEKAIFAALKLYANWQQGKTATVYGSVSKKSGLSLFTALRIFRKDAKNVNSLDKRVIRSLRVTDFTNLTKDLASLLGIMNSQGFNHRIDFALLAEDLYKVQLVNEEEANVVLKWCEQYFKELYGSQEKIYSATTKIINQVQSEPGVLASLRKSYDFTDKTARTVWPYIVGNLNPKLLSIGYGPSYAEKAIFMAMKFYAIWQQGQTQIMFGSVFDKSGLSIFEALNNFRPEAKSQKSLDRRVLTVLEYPSFEAVNTGLTSLLGILKGSGYKHRIDFALLASRLYRMQFDFSIARKVTLLWSNAYFKNVFNLEK